MKKILISLLLVSPLVSFADNASNYAQFQEFMNEYDLSYGASVGNWARYNTGNFTRQSIGINIQHLTDAGIWFDVSAGLLSSYTQNYPGNGYPSKLTGDYPIYGGVNGKLGYAFILPNSFMLTPYLSFGRNTNIATYTVPATIDPNANISTAYFLSMGGGVRADYRLNQLFDFYASQDVIYNLDMTDHSAATGLANSDNTQYVSSIGAMYNVTKLIQLGAGVNYTRFAFSNLQISPGSGFTNYATPQDEFGVKLSFGLTY